MRGNWRAARLFATALFFTIVSRGAAAEPPVSAQPRHYTIPIIDLSQETHRQVIVDREPGQYLGHPSTVLLKDNRTILAVYPKGHGRGALVMKKSTDGGLTWSERLPVPENWATSKETPTIFRVTDPQGVERLILFSGLYPIRMAVSEDNGETWTPLNPIGDFGGIVAVSSVVRLKDGTYMAMFHDDGRFLHEGGRRSSFKVYKTLSTDGGLTWSAPEVVTQHPTAHLCEPGVVRSPDGRQLACLLRENSRQFNSMVIFSDDEGKTWSKPVELPGSLTGDRHVCRYGPDGRLVIVFRDTTHVSPTRGDFVAWVGSYNDIVHGREGQYRVRLLDNKKGADTGYAGLELLPDGTFVATTYCHLIEGEAPLIASVRFKLDEIDAKAKSPPQLTDVFVSGKDGYHTYRIPSLIVTKEGTVLAFCEGRKNSRSDTGDIDLVLKRSLDNGKTWQRMQIVWDDGGNTCGNPCPVVDRDTGRIWLLMTHNLGADNEGQIVAGTSKGTRTVWVTYSADDGLTWAKPVEITKAVKKSNWSWYATGPGVGIQLRHGRYKGRMVIPCDHKTRGDEVGYCSHVFYSDDHGKSWKLGASTENGVNECQVIERTDGSLLLNMRRSRHNEVTIRAIAGSTDGGVTWSKLSYDETLISPRCQASLLRYNPSDAAGKPTVLFSNPADKRQRIKMTVRLSHDDGRTWPVAKLLHAGPSAYSCLTVLPDRSIGCLYERGDKHPYETIAFTRFSLAWLTDETDPLKEEDSPVASGVSESRSGGVTAPRPKYLLLDSRVVESVENVKLAVGEIVKHSANPLFKEDNPWEVRFDNLYPNVIYDGEDRIYKCWYSPFIRDKGITEVPPEKRRTTPYRPRDRVMGVCYAVSKDGVAWEKPELGVHRYDGFDSNIVSVGPHGAGVFKDSREPDPAKRYKMFCKYGRTVSVAFSPDGIRWGKPVPCPQVNAAGDTHNNAFWVPELKRYVGITRLWNREKRVRQVGRTESKDFLHWTEAEVVLEGLRPEEQTYAMTVFRYAGVHLGLLMIYRARPIDRTHCELAWSPDTIHWRRIAPGTPLIPNSRRKGDYDWGCVYAAACPVFHKGEVRLYYGASNGLHFGFRDGFLALATLRPDGFAGYRPLAEAQPGTIVTKPILCTGKNLRVSADAEGGSLRVGILDVEGFGLGDCQAITSDVTDRTVRWASRGDFSTLTGKRIRLRFELKSAMLYAFGFSG